MSKEENLFQAGVYAAMKAMNYHKSNTERIISEAKAKAMEDYGQSEQEESPDNYKRMPIDMIIDDAIKELEDWTKPDEDGNIHIPDELDGLFNKVGFQFRLHTFSGLNETECIARSIYQAQKYFNKPQNTELIEAAEKVVEVYESDAYADDIIELLNPLEELSKALRKK